jgi:uncharacterized protein (DUF2461 family)
MNKNFHVFKFFNTFNQNSSKQFYYKYDNMHRIPCDISFATLKRDYNTHSERNLTVSKCCRQKQICLYLQLASAFIIICTYQVSSKSQKGLGGVVKTKVFSKENVKFRDRNSLKNNWTGLPS